MELRHLRSFNVLAECTNFTQAAKQLHVSQSTLSHTIKQLEDELKVELFDRVGKRVTLNRDGKQFLGTVARTLGELDSGIVSLRNCISELSGELRIGTTSTFNVRLLPGCVSEFLTQNPTVHVTIAELPGKSIEERVRNGQLDVGICYTPSDTGGLWFEPLFNEELVIFAPLNHPLAKRRRIRMVELHRQPLILPSAEVGARHILNACFRAAHAQPTPVAEINSIVPMFELSRSLLIPTIGSEFLSKAISDFAVVRIVDPKPIRTPVLLQKQDGPQSATSKAFADILKRQCAHQSE
ncbi:LysR family cyn operon transcriptional activator [Burkholderia sp. PvR073]|uniref:LysR substrate-binding domain-containing protein n=1 Tax=Burkholderia TaxID=32008 RepID=UPI0025505337|nr:LysR substrate-binding domain-containing protein [Burkholderia sp. lyk4-R2A-23]